MLESFWQSLIDIATLQFISPFWFWVFTGAWVTALAFVVGWAFPPLRSFAGAVVLAVIVGLTGYRRAEHDVDRKRKLKEERERARQGDGWRW
jgi:hypothetical protein